MLSPAQKFTTLLQFNGTNGTNPSMALVQGADGDLYGTAGGGTAGDGTIFKITPAGAFSTLYNFSGPDGSGPGGLMLATDGNFYGVTGSGGAYGYGTVFKFTPQYSLTTMYSLTGSSEEVGPNSPLVEGYDGNFYGTMVGRGTNGVAFRITSSGTLTKLYQFSAASGAYPETPLILAIDGSLYGSTSSLGPGGWGTIFSMTQSGTVTQRVSFDLANGGSNAFLLQAANGELYGVTFVGGPYGSIYGLGTVFECSLDGSLVTLYDFSGPDGMSPTAPMVQATDGNFYGTTSGIGQVPTKYFGTIFQITPDGVLTTLHNFTDLTPFPTGGLLQATNGSFYGTTNGSYTGGTFDSGTIFKLDVGLASFVKTLPRAGQVDTTVSILGTDLTGATSVSFGGTAATFTVVSATEITTTVPAGATTGRVEVVTPSATLSSNVPFRVLQ
jgi:uncharacterized repeat protein (TIGR03803 family)